MTAPDKVQRLTPEAIDRLADEIIAEHVYLGRHCPPDLLPRVFMPLALGALADATEAYLADVAEIYEYLDKAGPLSVNGQPMFLSFKVIGKADWEIVSKKVAAMLAAMKTAKASVDVAPATQED